jgi:hypothetical protein
VTQERYEHFLGELPKLPPDPRQAAFLRAVGATGEAKKILIDQRLGKVEIANVGQGWYASAPDLAFLQAGMGRLIELGKLDPDSKKEVAQFVGWAVQRVLRVTSLREPDITTVHFWTKDDTGVFDYSFAVPHQPTNP